MPSRSFDKILESAKIAGPSTPRPLRREFRDDGATAGHQQLPPPAPPPPAGNRCAATS
jgi:hypothetical protein